MISSIVNNVTILTRGIQYILSSDVPKVVESAISGMPKEQVRSGAVLAMAVLAEAYQNPPSDLTSTIITISCGLGGAELITQGLCLTSQKIQDYTFSIVREKLGQPDLPAQAINEGISHIVSAPFTVPIHIILGRFAVELSVRTNTY